MKAETELPQSNQEGSDLTKYSAYFLSYACDWAIDALKYNWCSGGSQSIIYVLILGKHLEPTYLACHMDGLPEPSHDKTVYIIILKIK